MRSSLLVPVLLLGVGCATGSTSRPALVVQTYGVADLVADASEGSESSTAVLARHVCDAVAIDAATEQVVADGPGQIVVTASPGTQRMIEIVLADVRSHRSR